MTNRRLQTAQQHLERGDKLAWLQHRKTAALKEYQAALNLEPTMAMAHWCIGQVYFHARKRDLAAALAEFHETVRLAPEWNEGHFCCAITLQDLGRLEEALAAFVDAVRLEPEDARVQIALGECYFRMNRFEAAIECYREGLRLKPAYGEMAAHLMLAAAYRDNGQIDDAVAEWRIVAGTMPVWDYEQNNSEEARRMLVWYDPEAGRADAGRDYKEKP